MRYQVKVTREIVYETYVTVTAENADMAADEASSLEQRDVSVLTWVTAKDRRELYFAHREDVQPAPLTASASREGKTR